MDPHLEKIFTALCRDLSPEETTRLQKVIQAHLEAVRSFQGRQTPDLSLAEKISSALMELLAGYPSLPERHRELVAGAALYFVRQEDAQSDLGSKQGMADDLAVLNYVLEQLGRQDLSVSG